MGILIIADLVLLKIALAVTKTEHWKKMKWATASYFIQFGVVFAVGSPLFLLGMIGAFKGDPVAIIPIVFIAAFADVNIVNIIHRIGLRRSLIVVIFIIVPMVFIMRQFGDVISMVTKLMR
jgi:hypothetical protein